MHRVSCRMQNKGGTGTGRIRDRGKQLQERRGLCYKGSDFPGKASDCKKMIPVKTDKPVPKERIEELMKIINEKTLLLPISLGDIIIENIGGTGANVVCTRSFNI